MKTLSLANLIIPIRRAALTSQKAKLLAET
jgi:hypothetical protein